MAIINQKYLMKVVKVETIVAFNLNFQMSSVQTKRNFKCFHEVRARLAAVLPFTIAPPLFVFGCTWIY